MQAVSLKCSSCGASLSIPSDINHLACGFCGTEQVVVRDGGIVALKSVTDAIDRVKQSTDKTAAELALKRLREELNALVRHRDERRRYWQGQLDPKRNQLANMPSRYNNVWGTGLGSFVLCPAITIIIALQLFPGYQERDRLGKLLGLVIGFCIAALITLQAYKRANSDEWMENKKKLELDIRRTGGYCDEELRAIDSEIHRVERLITANRKLVDS